MLRKRKSTIRDFIYLDIERVRSFVAQISEGLVSETFEEQARELGATTELEGGIPWIAKGKGGGDYRFTKSTSETRSLHDYIFQVFMSYLDKQELLLDILEYEWNEKTFVDGMFVITKGVYKIIDYQAMVDTMTKLPDLVKLVEKLSPGDAASKKAADKSKLSSRSTLKQLDVVSDIIDNLYRDSIRIKIYPFDHQASQHFVGSGERDMFRYQPHILQGLYGKWINAQWNCVLQVNIGDTISDIETGFRGNQLDDQLETVFDGLSELSETLTGTSFPAVAMTPIAIYREI